MRFHEVIYEAPKYKELLTRTLFVPSAPVCDLWTTSSHAMALSKRKVLGCDFFVVKTYVVHVEDYVDMSGRRNLPHPRRSQFYRLPH